MKEVGNHIRQSELGSFHLAQNRDKTRSQSPSSTQQAPDLRLWM